MPKCSKYHAEWQVLVPNCWKYKANGKNAKINSKTWGKKNTKNYSTPVTYYGWKKSCTTLDGWNLTNNGRNHRSTGAIFLPCTYLTGVEHLLIQMSTVVFLCHLRHLRLQGVFGLACRCNGNNMSDHGDFYISHTSFGHALFQNIEHRNCRGCRSCCSPSAVSKVTMAATLVSWTHHPSGSRPAKRCVELAPAAGACHGWLVKASTTARVGRRCQISLPFCQDLSGGSRSDYLAKSWRASLGFGGRSSTHHALAQSNWRLADWSHWVGGMANLNNGGNLVGHSLYSRIPYSSILSHLIIFVWKRCPLDFPALDFCWTRWIILFQGQIPSA